MSQAQPELIMQQITLQRGNWKNSWITFTSYEQTLIKIITAFPEQVDIPVLTKDVVFLSTLSSHRDSIRDSIPWADFLR